jgi:outer membrane protein TolC
MNQGLDADANHRTREMRMTHGIRATLIGLAFAMTAAVAPPGEGQTSPPGGTPGSGQIPPPPAVGDTLRLAPATATESLLVAPPSGPGERWSLARCIETALKQNADAISARAAVQRASGSALSAWSGIIPSLSVDGSYSQTRPSKSSTDLGSFSIDNQTLTGRVTKRENTGLNATLSSNIIDMSAISDKKTRDHLSAGAGSDEAEIRNNVVFLVKTQYFEFLKADRLAIVARDTEKLARDEETRAEALFTVGTVARGDVLKAKARRSATQADRLQAENQVNIQQGRLKQLLGITATTPITVEAMGDVGLVIPDSAASIQQALTARPRLAAAKQAEDAAKSSLFGSKAQRLPAISGSVGLNYNDGKTTIGDISGIANPPDNIETTSNGTDWSGQVRASMPIFSGLSIEGNVRQAKADLIEAENNRRQREIDVTVQVQEAWLTLREAVQRIEVAREGLTSSEEDYKFSKGRYDLGAGTYLDLLTAEVQLAQARTTLVQALADARVAEAGLEFAIGAKRY